MNKPVAVLWVNALRSGKYTQTKGGLRDRNGMCCLGVLCDVFREVCHQGEWTPTGGAVGDSAFDTGKKIHHGEESIADTEKSVAPHAVVAWANMKDGNPVVRGEMFDTNTSIAELNDGMNWDFAMIADLIEAQYESL